MMKTAIVIINWNGKKLLEQFLPIIVNCNNNHDTGIFVIDNASSDQSVCFITENFPSVKTISLPANYGYAEGYNKGLKEIDADYYILVNSDVCVTENWVQPLIECLDNNPDIAVCQPKILSYNEKDAFEYAGACGGFIDKYGYPFCRGRIFVTIEKDENQYDNPIQIEWASGACFAIRSSIFKTCNGFDEFFFAHMEEIDLCWRIRNSGKAIACIPQSVVYHVGAATLSKKDPQKTYLNFRNNLLLLYKNLSPKQSRQILFKRFLLDYLAVFRYFFSGSLSVCKAIIKARLDFYKSKKKYTPYQGESNLGLYNKSLVFDYYFKRKKTFSSLHIETRKINYR